MTPAGCCDILASPEDTKGSAVLIHSIFSSKDCRQLSRGRKTETQAESARLLALLFLPLLSHRNHSTWRPEAASIESVTSLRPNFRECSVSSPSTPPWLWVEEPGASQLSPYPSRPLSHRFKLETLGNPSLTGPVPRRRSGKASEGFLTWYDPASRLPSPPLHLTRTEFLLPCRSPGDRERSR